MVKKALIAILAGTLLLGPAVVVLTIAVLMNPGTQAVGAGCISTPDTPSSAPLADDAPVPDEARPWITTATQTCPDLPEVWIAAIMAQESAFTPDAFADDVNGGTWGLLQINEHIWRTVYGDWSEDRNDNGVWDIKEPLIHAEHGATYLCNLLDDIRRTRQDHPEWASSRELSELEALVIAHNAGPGRLQTYPDIPAITRDYLDTVRQRIRDWAAPTNGTNAVARSVAADQPIPDATDVVAPLPDGTYTITSGFGLRPDPTNPSEQELHTGLDFGADEGTPILAVADGLVVQAELVGGRQVGTITIEHMFGEYRIATVYMHMWEDGIHVARGDRVSAGQHIGDVGSSGRSTGPHLHFEVRPGGAHAQPTDPAAWLRAHGLVDIEAERPDQPNTTECQPADQEPGDNLPPPPQPFTGQPGGQVPDPSGTDGWVTRQLEHLIAQTRRAFPDTGWACWDRRPGTDSDHPRGLACDVTFGNQIGEHPTDQQRTEGWRVTNWLRQHADTLHVAYLIFDGLIWSVNRSGEGWRPYDGGGMHDPDTPTGGHYDHLHTSSRP